MTQLLPKPSFDGRVSDPTEQGDQALSPEFEQPRVAKPWAKVSVILGSGVLLAAAIATGVWILWPRPLANALQLSGRIEGYETDIGAKVAGRVNFVAVREGDRVTKGQVLARLDDTELQAQLQGATARITAAQQQAEQARLQLSVIQSQIAEAQLTLQQARGETEGQVTQAESNLAAARAQLNQAKAQLTQAQSELKLAQMNRDRAAQLQQEGAYSQEQLDQAQTNLETAQATVNARQSAVEAALKQTQAAQGTLVQAQTTSLNPDIRVTQLNALREQLKIAKSQLAATQADVQNAQAARQQILAQIAYLNVVSPINGVVTTRSVEPGAVVGSGRTLLTLINPNTVYLRGYIPEGEIGKVRVGQLAQVWLDSHPNQPLKARVAAVDTEASFTPENIYFKQDRVRQVFGVKLSIDQPHGLAKPGMPADAEILTEYQGAWRATVKRIGFQCVKELAQFQRDRLTLALAFFLPLMTLLIFGFAIRLEAKNIPLIVQDWDRSNLSRTYTDRLFATNQFVAVPWSGENPEAMIDRGRVKAVVIIPPDFSRRIRTGRSSNVQVLVDGTDTNNARIIRNSIKATTNFFLRTAGLMPDSSAITVRTRLWFNPGRKESLYIVPGVYAVALWIFPSLLAAIAMVREKEKGTMIQVYASSLTATELLLGKGLAYLIISTGIALVVIMAGSIIFQLSFAGDPLPLLISTPIFLGVSVLFGLLLGVRTNSQNAAVQGVALIGFITALLLSGFIYPLSNIPFPLSLVPLIVPARYYIEITRDAFVRGIGWPGVWLDVFVLVILGLVLFNVARHGLSRMQLPN